jgi:hypothetical protein
MWLSLICTKLSSPAPGAAAIALPPSSAERGMPPLTVQSTPVPAQSMHFRNPRRCSPASSSIASFGRMAFLFGLLPL